MISMWTSSTIAPIIKRMLVPSRLLVNASCRALSSENIDDIPRGQSSTSSSNDAPEGGEGFYKQTGRVMEWKDGDWLCDSCGNHVFASRQVCPRCNTAKLHQDVRVQPIKTVGWADAYTDIPKQSTASPRHKPGDWDCSACGFHNYASRHVCFRCKNSRPDGVGVFVSGKRGTANAFPELYKPGDWECPSCKAHNYASRLACFRCRLPKTHEARVFGGDPNRRVTSFRISRDVSCEGLSEVESEEESSTFAESSAETKQNQDRW